MAVAIGEVISNTFLQFPVEVKVPAGWAECAGCPSVRDCHVEEVKVPDRMKLLSDSVEIARLDVRVSECK